MATTTHQHEAWQIRTSAQGGTYCAACGENLTLHQSNIEDESTENLQERYAVLDGHRSYLDPRCGCGEDGEGARCFWDDPDQIDAELTRRGH